MNYSIIICGVGGQGTILLSTVVANAAFKQGYHVKKSDIKGFAVRGGTVLSYVRFGDKKVSSPIPPQGSADLMLATEPLEALRQIAYMKKEGTVIMSANSIPTLNYKELDPAKFSFESAKTRFIDTTKISKEVGSPYVQNIILLGAASNLIPLDKIIVAETIRKLCPYPEINLKAFNAGIQCIEQEKLDKTN